jgi:ElaB/YqjD/DUF883 family membrane-anchored ribosome-binding protein
MIADSLASRTEEIDRIGNSAAARIAETLSDRTAELDRVSATAAARITDSLAGRTDEIDRISGAAASRIADTLSSHTAELGRVSDEAAARIEASIEGGTGRIEERLGTMDRALSIGLDNVSRTIEGKAAGLVTNLRGAVSDAAQGIDAEAVRSAELLAKAGDDFAQAMAARQADFQSSIEQTAATAAMRSAELARSVGEATDGAAARIAQTQARVAEQASSLQRSLTDVEKALEARGNTIRTTLDDSTRELNSMLAGRSAELSRLIDEKARPVIDQYAATGKEAADRISEVARESAERLRAENATLLESLTARTGETLNAISNRAEETAKAMKMVENRLQSTALGLIDQLAASNSSIAGVIEQASANLGAMDEQLESTTARFSESANRASDMLSTSTRLLEGKVTKLAEISGSTLSQIGGIVGRFEDHSKVLSQASDLLGAAQSNLVSTLEERQDALRTLSVGLVSRSEEIEKTMHALEGFVDGAFQRAEDRSAQIAGNLRSGIQTSFNDVGRILTDAEQRAAAAAEAMRNAVVKAGSEASMSVESVFVRAEERSSEIASNLRTGVEASFADVSKTLSEAEARAMSASEAMRTAVAKASEDAGLAVEGAFTRAEERSKEVASRLRGSVGASLSDIDRMMTETGKKSDGAAQQIGESIRQAVEEAVGRFSGATDEIRRAANEIRRELDMTREELKRGAFDLPEEAKENASVMRRAVAEQIKALQELSDIIGKSSGQLEIAQPRQQAVAQQQPVAAATVRAVAQQPAAEPRRPEQEPLLRGSLGLEQPRPAAQQPVVRQQEPAAVTARPQSGEGSGWMRDLLRGASRDEEAPAPVPAQRPSEAQPAARAGDTRNPRHVMESLNSLSVDIARAIDHDASVDLWRRYQRGERDVFTRRLYTLKGQQTFDEIKRKYDREPEFRTAVDRYIADFEKLLGDVSRNDRDKVMTQSYLTSDTGKVYTMLAHAAGRFS